MVFWIFAALLLFLVTLIVLLPILRGTTREVGGAISDVAVYKDQLKELDADIARGVLSESEAEASRLEISRRLLAADARDKDELGAAPQAGNTTAIVAISATLIAGSALVYGMIGAPGIPDQPLAERLVRLTQEEAEIRYAESGAEGPRALSEQEADLLDRLREALKERPDDLTGHKLLVQTLNSIGDYSGAWQGQAEVLRILGDDASDEDFTDKAELMIFAAGGMVSPSADQVLSQALQLSPTNQRARFYSGISLAQNGRPELAMQLWSGLMTEGAPNAPWKAPVRAQMQQLSQNTGIPIPEGTLSGPTAEDMEAASDMSENDRMEMIRGMVEGLSDRLATDGGSSAEWARLIRALAVLGDTERAQAIYREAQEVFASDPASLAQIEETARASGLE